MKLSEIGNMEEYLQNDCYCPGEIYDISGFFFQVFSKDDDCELIGKGVSENDKVKEIVCVACKDQLINFWIDFENEIVNAERYDATENNINQIKLWLINNSEKVTLDEFKNGETRKNLEQIMKCADAIMVD